VWDRPPVARPRWGGCPTLLAPQGVPNLPQDATRPGSLLVFLTMTNHHQKKWSRIKKQLLLVWYCTCVMQLSDAVLHYKSREKVIKMCATCDQHTERKLNLLNSEAYRRIHYVRTFGFHERQVISRLVEHSVIFWRRTQLYVGIYLFQPRFAGSNLAEDDGFLRAIKICNTTFFGGE
jgi:hypothetical protein